MKIVYLTCQYSYSFMSTSIKQKIKNQSCQNLEQAFQNGFDNYDTVRVDPDLSAVHGKLEFDALMEKWNPKKGLFNGFGLFKK